MRGRKKNEKKGMEKEACEEGRGGKDGERVGRKGKTEKKEMEKEA